MGLKFKFNNSAKDAAPAATENILMYETEGTARTACFVSPDGKHLSLYYAHLQCGTFDPANNTVTLTFATHTVTLKGYRLADLFNDVMKHKARHMQTVKERYATMEENNPVITNMEIKPL